MAVFMVALRVLRALRAASSRLVAAWLVRWSTAALPIRLPTGPATTVPPVMIAVFCQSSMSPAGSPSYSPLAATRASCAYRATLAAVVNSSARVLRDLDKAMNSSQAASAPSPVMPRSPDIRYRASAVSSRVWAVRVTWSVSRYATPAAPGASSPVLARICSADAMPVPSRGRYGAARPRRCGGVGVGGGGGVVCSAGRLVRRVRKTAVPTPVTVSTATTAIPTISRGSAPVVPVSVAGPGLVAAGRVGSAGSVGGVVWVGSVPVICS